MLLQLKDFISDIFLCSLVHYQLFFHSIADFIPDFVVFFQQYLILDEKSHAIRFIKNSYKSTHFWKHDAQMCNCFIILLTNKMLKTCTTSKLVGSCYLVNIYIVSADWTFGWMKLQFFNFIINEFQNFSAHLLIRKNIFWIVFFVYFAFVCTPLI